MHQNLTVFDKLIVKIIVLRFNSTFVYGIMYMSIIDEFEICLKNSNLQYSVSYRNFVYIETLKSCLRLERKNRYCINLTVNALSINNVK